MYSKTVSEAVEMLGCSRDTIFRFLRDGKLQKADPVKSGKSGRPKTMITTYSIVNYLKGGNK